jgi:gamma-glutamylputrescine oxidase
MFSFWEKQQYLGKYDLLIIGSGFTGLSAGITLLKSKPGLRVAIIESATIGTLASSRNAGFMCYGSPSELGKELTALPPATMLQMIRNKHKGMKLLLQFAGKRGIQYKKVTGYEVLQSNAAATNTASQSYQELNKLFKEAIGITDYFAPATKRHFAAGFQETIAFAYEGQLNPAATVFQLTQLFKNLGGIHLNATTAHGLEKSEGHFVIPTSLGNVQAHQVIVATNAFTSSLIPSSQIQPKRAQILITNPIAKLPYLGNFHMDFGYVYFRNVGNRLLLGGARNKDFETENSANLALNPLIQTELDTLLQQLLPDQNIQIEDRWAGIMGFDEHNSPQVRLIDSNLLLVAGMNGMGTALGPALGYEAANKLLADRFIGHKPIRISAFI